MALVNIDTALRDAVRIISKCPENSGVELLSYKRNRTVALIRLSDSTIHIRENGYIVEESDIDMSELQKKLKTIIKREFPRSRKVRFFKFSSPDELIRIRQKI